jgi:hypothetical protein
MEVGDEVRIVLESVLKESGIAILRGGAMDASLLLFKEDQRTGEDGAWVEIRDL